MDRDIERKKEHLNRGHRQGMTGFTVGNIPEEEYLRFREFAQVHANDNYYIAIKKLLDAYETFLSLKVMMSMVYQVKKDVEEIQERLGFFKEE